MVLAMDILKHMTFLSDIKTMMYTKKMIGLGLLLLNSHIAHIQIPPDCGILYRIQWPPPVTGAANTRELTTLWQNSSSREIRNWPGAWATSTLSTWRSLRWLSQVYHTPAMADVRRPPPIGCPGVLDILKENCRTSPMTPFIRAALRTWGRKGPAGATQEIPFWFDI